MALKPEAGDHREEEAALAGVSAPFVVVLVAAVAYEGVGAAGACAEPGREPGEPRLTTAAEVPVAVPCGGAFEPGLQCWPCRRHPPVVNFINTFTLLPYGPN